MYSDTIRDILSFIGCKYRDYYVVMLLNRSYGTVKATIEESFPYFGNDEVYNKIVYEKS